MANQLVHYTLLLQNSLLLPHYEEGLATAQQNPVCCSPHWHQDTGNSTHLLPQTENSPVQTAPWSFNTMDEHTYSESLLKTISSISGYVNNCFLSTNSVTFKTFMCLAQWLTSMCNKFILFIMFLISLVLQKEFCREERDKERNMQSSFSLALWYFMCCLGKLCALHNNDRKQNVNFRLPDWIWVKCAHCWPEASFIHCVLLFLWEH